LPSKDYEAALADFERFVASAGIQYRSQVPVVEKWISEIQAHRAWRISQSHNMDAHARPTDTSL
jgi:hypothetical protein